MLKSYHIRLYERGEFSLPSLTTFAAGQSRVKRSGALRATFPSQRPRSQVLGGNNEVQMAVVNSMPTIGECKRLNVKQSASYSAKLSAKRESTTESNRRQFGQHLQKPSNFSCFPFPQKMLHKEKPHSKDTIFRLFQIKKKQSSLIKD